MPITPDTKDWTWVVDRACSECGLDASAYDPREVAELIRENAAAWPEVLAGDRAGAGEGAGAGVAVRPDEQTWSRLEYAAHVRDVYRLFAVRLQLMLDEDDPLFANWDQDATAVAERYNEQDPGTVAAEIVEAASALADAFEGVPESDWERTGRRSDGARFTVATFARYLLHDPVHHLWDVRR